MLDLVLKDPERQQSPDCLNYLKSHLPSEVFMDFESPNESQKAKILDLLKDENVQKTTLEKHNMFKLMNGNPQSIITFAHFYNMKFVGNNCLYTIYDRMIRGDQYIGNES